MGIATSSKDLSSIWLFSECSGRDLRSIARALDEVSVPKGRVLIEEGTMGRELFLIASGTASVTRDGKKVATLGPGSHFGELGLLVRQPRNATVIADTDMDVLVLGQRQLNGLLESIPALSRKLMSAMASRLREQDAKAVH